MEATSKRKGPLAGRADEVQAGDGRRSWWKRALEAVRESAWTALGGKVVAYGAGFFALALVGSGHALSLLPARGADPAAGLAMVGGGTAPLGGETAPLGGETAPLGGETAPLGGAGDAGSAPPQGTVEPAADAGAPAEPPPSADGGTSAPAGGGVTADGKVVLNLATEADLMRLPGVGPAKAAAIVALRAKMKRFRKVDDLLRVKGLGRRSLKRLRPLVLVDPP
ncbi:helix-hairpin-helix domain-containing protein [Sorangium sp. So ce1024]|uniref:ComEA family DNA-binding protein n=1 Tax=unclassified Sorangium TaxID=2621164 RepID=UPI003F0D805B